MLLKEIDTASDTLYDDDSFLFGSPFVKSGTE
jgi:hypothetical protein